MEVLPARATPAVAGILTLWTNQKSRKKGTTLARVASVRKSITRSLTATTPNAVDTVSPASYKAFAWALRSHGKCHEPPSGSSARSSGRLRGLQGGLLL